MPPALRKGPVFPARAAAVLASPPDSLSMHRPPDILVLEPALCTCLDRVVAR
ncbi:hypothetical protein [Streptomyces sp. SID13726]|uniref:hypothetical protein n=1 Tax=Streptomyces sp. SID13726 TaxID=2706058 RepID=UPI0013BC9AF4|nr:hypothetical protein [Streptomyces sp. SID13726]NEB01911.1 hypothetical protein [Streptomyces sp. SID13726]